MKLFIYDHCPYCVKARMIFGLKNQTVKTITLLNDDEKTPVSMIGQKMLPILETSDGKFMPESLDIIEYIDKKLPPSIIVMKESTPLMNLLSEINFSYYSLAMPRWVKSNMEEFNTAAARKYFQKKKEKSIGSFAVALKKTSTFKKEVETALKNIADRMALNIKKNPGQWFLGKSISLNDFHLFAFLRGLTIVEGLLFPPDLKKYMKRISKKTKIPLNC